MNWLIYKHTNRINGKVYIGQTKQTATSRWKNGLGYFSKGRVPSIFAKAIKKYGWESFDHSIVEDNIASQEEANEREIYWIKYYNSYIGFVDCNGYNMTLGGDSGDHLGYPVYQIDRKTMKIINEFPSTSEASRYLLGTEGIGSHIRLCCEGRKPSCKGYYWCYTNRYNDNWKPKDNELVSPVYQINDELEVVRKFTSITEAKELFGYSSGTIVQCCKRKCRKANGYYWCYKEDYCDDWEPVELSFKRNEKIYCFETKKVYKNSFDASKQTNINRGSILKCCSHRELNSAGGLHFCFYNEKDSYSIENNKDESPVVCINTGIHYKNIAEAAFKTHTNPSGISSCCRKVCKTANKLSWCYESEYSADITPNNPMEKPIICIETKIRYNSGTEACKTLGIPHSTFGTALKNHSPAHGLHFCYEDEINTWTPSINKTKRQIICIETNVIYESARDADRKTGIKFGNIFAAIKSGGTAGGYHWKYIDEKKN